MKKYQSDIARSVHTDAEALYKVGAIGTKEMHEFDVDCLVPSAIPIRAASSSGGDSRPNAPIPAVAAARG